MKQFWLLAKDRYKTEDELTVFDAIDFENTSFHHAVQTQDTVFIYFLQEVAKELGGNNLHE